MRRKLSWILRAVIFTALDKVTTPLQRRSRRLQRGMDLWLGQLLSTAPQRKADQ
jgi:hypothetical protein